MYESNGAGQMAALAKNLFELQQWQKCVVQQCGGSGSVESVSFPWIRIRIKKWLDPESGSVSNDTDPDPTKTIENIK